MEYKKKYTDLETGEVVTISIGDIYPSLKSLQNFRFPDQP